MTVIRDFKGRLYELKEISQSGVLLRCLSTGSNVRIRNKNWGEIGFLEGGVQ